MREVLLVTGASSDIGMNFIKEAANDYSYIWTHFNSSCERIEELQEQFGEKIVPIKADFRQSKQIEKMLTTILEDGRLPHSILHIPAQPLQYKGIDKLSWDDYEDGINISTRSIQILLTGLLPHMLVERKGHILFMLSAYTVGVPPKYLSTYITAKYALLGMMKALAAEVADREIVVNGLSPEMIGTRYINDLPHLIMDKNAKDSPIKRNLETDDIIPMMRLLLSSENTAIMGENICISAGKR